ncbi:MAG: hypothetical protein SCH71_11215 [Desulfobulbaceae bacterium]|nr:hypothetical protein [Desulfobulbaceae bacterium]
MIHVLNRLVILVGFSLVLIAGCGAPPESAGKKIQEPLYPVTCIGVLPAVPAVDVDKELSPEELENLHQGAKVMNMLLAQKLGEQERIFLVGEEDMSGLELSGTEDSLDTLRQVGQSISCNAILETTVRRYTERIGTKWSVEQPAAVAFQFRLIGVDIGNILWSAKFDEEQISLLENLYNLGKAKTRGFTWITAADLMLEGIQEKLSASPYFNKLLPRDIREKSPEFFEDKV